MYQNNDQLVRLHMDTRIEEAGDFRRSRQVARQARLTGVRRPLQRLRSVLNWAH